jgi:Flp pilus assembly CpaF family ATPase
VSTRQDAPAAIPWPGAGAVTGGPDEQAVTGQLRAHVAVALARHAQDREETGQGALPPGERHAVVSALISQALEEHATAALRSGQPALDAAAEKRVTRAVTAALLGLGGLQALLDDPQVENIDVNGHDQVFARYADGRIARAAPVAASDADLVELIRTIAARAGTEERRFDRASPRLTIQLPDGSRLFAVMSVTRRPCISVRRHRHARVTLDDLARLGTVDHAMAGFLSAAVRARKNILVAGGTSIGKTTLLRALAAEIPPHERLVTIEDTFELGLDADPARHPNVVAMQAREANIEGTGEIGLAELVRWGLRMNPARVIVGEIRGPELIAMLNVMSQGNDGSMATVHSSSSRGVFTKLAAYAAQSPERLNIEATGLLVASAIHFVVHLAWSTDGVRVVSSVREIVDAEGPQIISNEVWRPGPGRRAVPGARLRDDTMDELAAAGFDPALAQAEDRW